MKKILCLMCLCFILVGCNKEKEMTCKMKSGSTSYQQVLSYEGTDVKSVKVISKTTYDDLESLNKEYNNNLDDDTISVDGLTLTRTYQQKYDNDTKLDTVKSQLEKLGFSCK